MGDLAYARSSGRGEWGARPLLRCAAQHVQLGKDQQTKLHMPGFSCRRRLATDEGVLILPADGVGIYRGTRRLTRAAPTDDPNAGEEAANLSRHEIT